MSRPRMSRTSRASTPAKPSRTRSARWRCHKELARSQCNNFVTIQRTHVRVCHVVRRNTRDPLCCAVLASQQAADGNTKDPVHLSAAGLHPPTTVRLRPHRAPIGRAPNCQGRTRRGGCLTPLSSLESQHQEVP